MDDRHSSGKAATPPPSIIPLMSDYNLDFITQDLNYNHVIDMFRSVSSSPTNNNSYYFSNNNNNNNNNNNPAFSICVNSGNLDPLVFSRDVSDNYSGFFPIISDHNNDSVFNQFNNNNNYSPTMSCSNNNNKNPLVNQSFSGFEGETTVRGEEEDDDDEEEEEEDYMEGEQSSAATKGNNNNNNNSGSKKGKMDRSRTLISERKRRGRMKEKLYALRALVPNITKMDKASIVGDAVLYVQDMQMQSKNLKSQIEGLESSLKAAERSQGFADNNNNSSLAHFLPVCRLILQLDVRQIEDKEYYVKVVTNKGQGVAASLYKALDSLTSFIIRNSSLSTLYEQFIFTFTLNVAKCKEEFNLPNMKVWISGALLNQGFEFQAF